jgi:outer membrane murein-binding lipoprotein Lpp
MKNNDLFAKAYFKMLVAALPSILGMFNVAGTIATAPSDNISTENDDLLQLVTQLAGYFFSVKFNQADLNNEN